jgi:small conductance mechanosensitive channel
MKGMITLPKPLTQNMFDPATLVGAIFYFVVFMILASIAARVVHVVVAAALRRDRHHLIDRTAAAFVRSLAQISIYLVAFILYAHLVPALRSLGTALLASVSVASLIIGLAAQHTLGDLIAGIALVIYRPFQVGDNVQVSAPTGLESGIVESVSAGYTTLRTPDNRCVIVPNSVMATQIIINQTHSRGPMEASISISLTADIAQARQILLESVDSHPLVEEVLGCPVTQLDSSTVTLTVKARCANVDDAQQVEYFVYELAKQRFGTAGIEPYSNVAAPAQPDSPDESESEVPSQGAPGGWKMLVSWVLGRDRS